MKTKIIQPHHPELKNIVQYVFNNIKNSAADQTMKENKIRFYLLK